MDTKYTKLPICAKVDVYKSNPVSKIEYDLIKSTKHAKILILF